MSAHWSREKLIEFVADGEVMFFDRSSKPLPVPAWLGEHRGAIAAGGSRLALVHADDRHKVISQWWETSQNPGEVRTTQYRVQSDAGWVWERRHQVSLVGQPDVAAVVAVLYHLSQEEREEAVESLQRGEYEDVNLLIYETDNLGNILRTEGKVLEITGHSPEDVIGKSVLDHLHPDGFEDAVLLWIELMAGPPGTTRTARQRVQRPDGETVWVEATTIQRELPDGSKTATVIVHDLTERRRQESALRVSQQQFRLIADRVPVAVFQADGDQRLTFRNDRWALLADGAEAAYLHELTHPDDRARHDAEIGRLLDPHGVHSVEYDVRSPSGERIYTVSCEVVFDLMNDVPTFLGSVTDITATDALRQRAERDPLTGVLNRSGLEAHFATMVEAGADGIALAFIDLDGFKSINDTYGHDAGDAVLVAVADRLAGLFRTGDVAARYGGDEFVVVLAGNELGDDAIVARIEAAMAQPVTWADGSWTPALSVGIARFQPSDDLHELVRRADLEMFAAKRLRKTTHP